MKTYRRALTIAGSDPSGGAGIQADLKTFSALGVYGMSAIVAVVDENTEGVTGVHPVPDAFVAGEIRSRPHHIGTGAVEVRAFVAGQIRSCLDDIGADAVKIGMLHSSALIRTVRLTLEPYALENIVFDPVMVATSGDALLESDAVATLRDELIPSVGVITPNVPEAEILLGHSIDSQDMLPDAARELSQDNRVSVLLKAGHLGGDSLTDIFYNARTGRMTPLSAPRTDTVNTHGTGCTLSSAFASFLALGASLDEAAVRAKRYIAEAIAAGARYRIGHGHGPVMHFYNYWEQDSATNLFTDTGRTVINGADNIEF